MRKTGKGKLIISRHPDTIGYSLKFWMADQDIIHIQAKTEFIIQHTIKQTCTDTVIWLYQITPLYWREVNHRKAFQWMSSSNWGRTYYANWHYRPILSLRQMWKRHWKSYGYSLPHAVHKPASHPVRNVYELFNPKECVSIKLSHRKELTFVSGSKPTTWKKYIVRIRIESRKN